MSTWRRLWPYLAFLFIVTVFAGVYYGNYITRLPFGIHEWAQSDRLAIAICFYDNGMNFFLPATLNQTGINGIVGVEFPIQSYLAAALAHIFGRENISTCFRVLDITIAFAGMLMLFHTCYKRTKDFFVSSLPPLFLFCVPVYVYYSGNYMPDPAAVSVACIGLCCFLDYADDRTRFHRLVAALLILTLATLIKTSSITYLAGVMLYAFIIRLRETGSFRKVLPVMLVSAACIVLVVANYLYIRYVNEHYNSWMFLLEARPFADWEEFVSFIEHVYKSYWMTEYFSLPQYLVYVMIVSAGLYLLLRRASPQRHGWLMLFFLAGSCTIAWAFGSQFRIHDYYVLAIFYPLVMYALVVSVLLIWVKMREASREARRAARVSISAGSLLLLFFTDFQMYRRVEETGPYAGNERSAGWLVGGDTVLARLQVPGNARIVALNESSPNLSLVYFDRKGHNLPADYFRRNMDTARAFMQRKHISYAVCREQTLRDILSNDSTALRNFEVLQLRDGKGILRLVR